MRINVMILSARHSIEIRSSLFQGISPDPRGLGAGAPKKRYKSIDRVSGVVVIQSYMNSHSSYIQMNVYDVPYPHIKHTKL